MSDETKTSALSTTEELNKAIQAAIDPNEIQAAILAEAEKQGLTRVANTAGEWVPSPAAEAKAAAEKAATEKAAAEKEAAEKAAANQAQSFSRVEVIGGQEFTFEAESELELERMVNNAYKVAFAVKQNEETVAEFVDPNQAAIDQAAAEKAAADRAELELKFKRGEISAQDYIEQSGAVKEYLEKQGVPLDELKKTIEEHQGNNLTKSWEEATQEFLSSSAGADWPGGQRNLEIIGLKLASLNLVDAEDKVAALAQAYNSMKQSGMIFPYEAPAVNPAVDKATAEKIAADSAAAAVTRASATRTAAATAQRSSSLFGTTGVSSGASPTASSAPKIDVPRDASPAEIMEAWKKTVVDQHLNPNDVFMDAFRGRR